jgi:hypothetical protein
MIFLKATKLLLSIATIVDNVGEISYMKKCQMERPMPYLIFWVCRAVGNATACCFTVDRAIRMIITNSYGLSIVPVMV